MISLPDREIAIGLIDEAVDAGARRHRACAELGLSERTYRRWKCPHGGVRADRRAQALRAPPPNKLSEAERAEVLALCHAPEFASTPPSQIVPRLADQGRYVASESSFYRILHQHDEQRHRGRAHAPRRSRAPSTHRADGPCQVWCWDVSFLRSPVMGMFYYLYMMVDLYSRKVVGWEVHDSESGSNAAALVHRAVLAEQCIDTPLVLHADNGAIQKSYTLRRKLEQLGIEPSYSRPRVSNDNAYSEALFRTCKYRPDYPTQGFTDLSAARQWVSEFVHWYNEHHRHSAIRYVTPGERQRGEDIAMLKRREALYAQAKSRRPNRWSGRTRNWTPVGAVWLNPEKPPTPALETVLETE